MKLLALCGISIGASFIAGCASLTPQDYGFRSVAIQGEERFCAPREWVVPPVVALEAANDPDFPLYSTFLSLPVVDFVSDAHPPMRGVCITQAQWPQWLMMRNQWMTNWAVTPGMAEALVAGPPAGS